jgi:hypothetical protein
VPGGDLPTIENIPPPTMTAPPTVTASGLQIYDIRRDGRRGRADGIVYIVYKAWVKVAASTRTCLRPRATA